MDSLQNRQYSLCEPGCSPWAAPRCLCSPCPSKRTAKRIRKHRQAAARLQRTQMQPGGSCGRAGPNPISPSDRPSFRGDFQAYASSNDSACIKHFSHTGYIGIKSNDGKLTPRVSFSGKGLLAAMNVGPFVAAASTAV